MRPGNENSTPRPAIPDHELLNWIGGGSYGDVWLARSITGQYRAVKVVYRNSFAETRPFDREFDGVRNYEPISRSHPGLVPILHVGLNENAGYFYYIMEPADDQAHGQEIDPGTYIPRTLSMELQRHGRLPLEECLQIGLSLTLALEHLHQQELIHRDIKPSNVIFLNGIAKLADIGLVAGIRGTSSIVGTEGFMPQDGPGTPSADLYSLGKVLYEISTGKDRMDFPELPTDVDTLTRDARMMALNRILLRACHNKPDKRYARARPMHEELLAAHQGVQARGKDRFPRWIRVAWRRIRPCPSPASPNGSVSGVAVPPPRPVRGPRRLPVYLLLDCSGSMRGASLQAGRGLLADAVRILKAQHSHQAPVVLTVILYRCTALQLVPLTPCDLFDLAPLDLDRVEGAGTASLIQVWHHLGSSIDLELTQAGQPTGDAHPIVICLTDGECSDPLETGRFHDAQKSMQDMETLGMKTLVAFVRKDCNLTQIHHGWLHASFLVPREHALQQIEVLVGHEVRRLKHSQCPIIYPKGYREQEQVTLY